MSYALKWMPRAGLTFNGNIDYLRKEWNEQVLRQFFERVSKVLENIQNNPLLYPIYNHSKKIHRCVIHERIILYYRIRGNTIELLLFWNTYRDPRKLKL